MVELEPTLERLEEYRHKKSRVLVEEEEEAGLRHKMKMPEIFCAWCTRIEVVQRQVAQDGII
jgi:hypothetical protein